MMLSLSARPCVGAAGRPLAGRLAVAAAALCAVPAAASELTPAHLLFAGVPMAYAQLAPGPAASTLRERVEAIPGVAVGDPTTAVAVPGVAVGGAAAAAQQTRASLSGFGYWSRVGADINGPSYKSRGGGVTFAVDRVLAPTFLAGVALSYARGETSSLGADSDTDTVSGALYAAWLPYLGWEFEGLVGIDGTEIDTRRVLTFGTTPVVTRGETDALAFNAVGNVGYRFRFALPAGAAFFKPFVGLTYASQDRDGYAEVGALGPGLVFPSKTFERSTFNLGAAAGVDLAAGNGWIIRPEVRVAWSHYLSDPNPAVPALVGGTIPVVLRDPDPGRDGAVVALEVTALTGGFQVFAGYAGEFRDNSEAHQGRAGLRITW